MGEDSTVNHAPLLILVLKRKLKKIEGRISFYLNRNDLSKEAVVPSSKIVINLYRIISYTVKKNHIGSAVSMILRYRETITKVDTQLLLYSNQYTV